MQTGLARAAEPNPRRDLFPFEVSMNATTLRTVPTSLLAAIAFTLAGCATAPEDPSPSEDFPVPVSSDVEPQRDDTTWTTSDVCKACGCTVSGFQCNCGLTPSPKKLECIKNGGPTKVISATLAP